MASPHRVPAYGYGDRHDATDRADAAWTLGADPDLVAAFQRLPIVLLDPVAYAEACAWVRPVAVRTDHPPEQTPPKVGVAAYGGTKLPGRYALVERLGVREE